MNGSFKKKAILKTVKLLLLNDYYFIDRMELVIPNLEAIGSNPIGITTLFFSIRPIFEF